MTHAGSIAACSTATSATAIILISLYNLWEVGSKSMNSTCIIEFAVVASTLGAALSDVPWYSEELNPPHGRQSMIPEIRDSVGMVVYADIARNAVVIVRPLCLNQFDYDTRIEPIAGYAVFDDLVDCRSACIPLTAGCAGTIRQLSNEQFLNQLQLPAMDIVAAYCDGTDWCDCL